MNVLGHSVRLGSREVCVKMPGLNKLTGNLINYRQIVATSSAGNDNLGIDVNLREVTIMVTSRNDFKDESLSRIYCCTFNN